MPLHQPPGGVGKAPAAHRALITPAKRGRGRKAKEADEPQTPAERYASMTRAQRLKRVFNIEIETCPVCGGQVRIIACIEDPAVIKRILDHLDRQHAQPAKGVLPEGRAPPVRRLE